MKKIVILILLACLCACQRTKPQAPSNRYHKTDTLGVGMVLLNQRLAEEADIQLRKYVKGNNLNDLNNLQLTETGVWYQQEMTKTARLKKNDVVTLKYTISTLRDSLLLDNVQSVTVGRRETIAAIDDMLYELGRGEKVVMFVPWHQAYGATGNKYVPAYTNIKIELEVQ